MKPFLVDLCYDGLSLVLPFVFSYFIVDELIRKPNETLTALFDGREGDGSSTQGREPGGNSGPGMDAQGECEPSEMTLKESVRAINKTLKYPFAKVIGRLERTLYMYAAFIADYQLVAGWLVMKSFFTWLSHREEDAGNKLLAGYYLYLYGNLLSLIYGILCGLAWLFLRRVLFEAHALEGLLP